MATISLTLRRQHRAPVVVLLAGILELSALAGCRQRQGAAVVVGFADANGRAYIAATPSLAVFGAAADGSGNEAADVRRTVADSRHPQSTLTIVHGTAHGVSIFESDGDLKPSIVKWVSYASGLSARYGPCPANIAESRSCRMIPAGLPRSTLKPRGSGAR
jgi:hypothetical protein